MGIEEQAEFEYEIRMQGRGRRVAQPSRAAASTAACSRMAEFHCKLEDGKLLLLDLGARVDGYCADITRTYPINGKYTPRQRKSTISFCVQTARWRRLPARA